MVRISLNLKSCKAKQLSPRTTFYSFGQANYNGNTESPSNSDKLTTTTNALLLSVFFVVHRNGRMFNILIIFFFLKKQKINEYEILKALKTRTS